MFLFTLGAKVQICLTKTKTKQRYILKSPEVELDANGSSNQPLFHTVFWHCLFLFWRHPQAHSAILVTRLFQ